MISVSNTLLYIIMSALHLCYGVFLISLCEEICSRANMCQMIKVKHAPNVLPMNIVYCTRYTYLVFMTFRMLAVIPFLVAGYHYFKYALFLFLKFVTMAGIESGVCDTSRRVRE